MKHTKDIHRFLTRHSRACTATALLVIGLGLLLCRGVGYDNDTLWLLKEGAALQNGLHAGAVPEPWSWYGSQTGAVWFQHTWLSGAALYRLAGALGPGGGAVLYHLLFGAALGAVLIWQAAQSQPGRFALPGLAAVSCAALAVPRGAGMYSAEGLFLAVAVIAVYRLHQNEHSRLIFALPIITALWANLHGVMVWLMLAVPGLALALSLPVRCDLVEQGRPGKRRLGKLTAVLALNAAAVGVNPNGYRLYGFIRENNLREKLAASSTWAPATIENAPLLFVALGCLALLLVLNAQRARVNLAELGYLAGSLCMALYCVHDVPYFFACAAAFCACHGELFALPGRDSFRRFGPWLAAAVFAAGVLAGGVGIARMAAKDWWAGNKPRVSPPLLAAIRDFAPQRIYNNLNTGSSLIDGGIPCFVDIRTEPYDEEAFAVGLKLNVRVYNSAYHGGYINIDEAIEQYRFDSFLVSRGESMEYWLAHHEGYRLIAQDDTYSFWAAEYF